jgi:hypothetical protein
MSAKYVSHYHYVHCEPHQGQLDSRQHILVVGDESDLHQAMVEKLAQDKTTFATRTAIAATDFQRFTLSD